MKRLEDKLANVMEKRKTLAEMLTTERSEHENTREQLVSLESTAQP